MLQVLTSSLLPLALVVAAPAAMAKEPDKAQMKKDFEQWNAETSALFKESWTGIVAAEAAAEPAYTEGVKLVEAGKDKQAVKKFLAARAKLFNGPNGRFVHVNKGLSFKIAMALAAIYERAEDWPRLKGEIFFMDTARPWLSKEEEKQVFMYQAAKEVLNVYMIEEARTRIKRMKSKDRRRLLHIMSYLVIGTTDVLFQDGYDLRNAWKKTAQKAEGSVDKDIYEDFGGQGDVEDHYSQMAAAESNFPVGGVVLVTNQEVSKVTKKSFTIDFTETRMEPVNCKSTGKVLAITKRGRFVYKQKCEFREGSGGHKLTIRAVPGLKLKKGDLVTMYAPVEKVLSDKGEVKMDVPAVVHSSRKGKTQWLLGIKTKKPAYIQEDGDFHIILHDDAEAPPKVK